MRSLSRKRSRRKSRRKNIKKSKRKSRKKSRRKSPIKNKYAQFGWAKDSGWIIYEKEGCGYCQKAKELLAPYHPKVIDGPSNLSEIERKIPPEFKTWPKIFKGDKFIGGYNDLIKIVK